MSVVLPWCLPASATSAIESSGVMGEALAMSHTGGYVLQQLFNMVQLAGFYLPLAMAFAILQAITRRIFLSFGDLAMFGSFTAVYLAFDLMLHGQRDLPTALLSLAGAIICGAAFGYALARVFLGQTLLATPLAYMIASIGFGIALQEAMRLQSMSRDIWVPPLFAQRFLVEIPGSFPGEIVADGGPVGGAFICDRGIGCTVSGAWAFQPAVARHGPSPSPCPSHWSGYRADRSLEFCLGWRTCRCNRLDSLDCLWRCQFFNWPDGRIQGHVRFGDRRLRHIAWCCGRRGCAGLTGSGMVIIFLYRLSRCRRIFCDHFDVGLAA